MTFMYLHLRTNEQGGINAEVKNDGTFTSLGGPNSQRSDRPFAVFRIESFEGLSFIDEDMLLIELFKRYSTADLASRLQIRFTDKELLNMLSDRLKEGS
jgi:hypothetical protein